jgi:Cu/Ag efflux protein CusF
MVRSTKWLVVVLALGIVAGLAAPVYADETKGKIKSITAATNEFVFTDNDGKDWTFQMDKNGKVQLGTKNVKLDDLKAGDKVTVVYDKQGDKLIAKEIRCERDK